MASKVLLQAEPRTKLNSTENRRIRKKGLVPAVIFGKGISSTPITVKNDEVRKIIKKHGRNTIVNLKVNGGKTYSVIVKNVTFSRLTGGYEHIDFQNISMSDEIKAEVSLKINGRDMLESKRLVLIRQQDTIKIKGLPQNIPEFVETDVSQMEAGSTLTVGDISFPEGIVSEEDNETLLLSVSYAKTENISTHTDYETETNE